MIDYSTLTEKQQKRYKKIVSVAEELMYQQGFYKLSLADLTKKLSISRSTIYEYFGSKEGLVEIVVDTISGRLNRSLLKAVKDKELSSHEKFVQLAQTQSENLNANCYRLFNDLKIHMPILYKQFEEERKKREKGGYERLIEQGLEEGIFDEKFEKDFLVQLYLKMGQLTGDTDILEHIRMNKKEAMETIINVFLNGTKKT